MINDKVHTYMIKYIHDKAIIANTLLNTLKYRMF